MNNNNQLDGDELTVTTPVIAIGSLQQQAETELRVALSRARKTLFFVGGIYLLAAVYEGYKEGGEAGVFAVFLGAVLAFVFMILGLAIRRKPLRSLIISISIFGLLWLFLIAANPDQPFQGALVNFSILISLLTTLQRVRKALRAATARKDE